MHKRFQIAESFFLTQHQFCTHLLLEITPLHGGSTQWAVQTVGQQPPSSPFIGETIGDYQLSFGILHSNLSPMNSSTLTMPDKISLLQQLARQMHSLPEQISEILVFMERKQLCIVPLCHRQTYHKWQVWAVLALALIQSDSLDQFIRLAYPCTADKFQGGQSHESSTVYTHFRTIVKAIFDKPHSYSAELIDSALKIPLQLSTINFGGNSNHTINQSPKRTSFGRHTHSTSGFEANQARQSKGFKRNSNSMFQQTAYSHRSLVAAANDRSKTPRAQNFMSNTTTTGFYKRQSSAKNFSSTGILNVPRIDMETGSKHNAISTETQKHSSRIEDQFDQSGGTVDPSRANNYKAVVDRVKQNFQLNSAKQKLKKQVIKSPILHWGTIDETDPQESQVLATVRNVVKQSQKQDKPKSFGIVSWTVNQVVKPIKIYKLLGIFQKVVNISIQSNRSELQPVRKFEHKNQLEPKSQLEHKSELEPRNTFQSKSSVKTVQPEETKTRSVSSRDKSKGQLFQDYVIEETLEFQSKPQKSNQKSRKSTINPAQTKSTESKAEPIRRNFKQQRNQVEQVPSNSNSMHGTDMMSPPQSQQRKKVSISSERRQQMKASAVLLGNTLRDFSANNSPISHYVLYLHYYLLSMLINVKTETRKQILAQCEALRVTLIQRRADIPVANQAETLQFLDFRPNQATDSSLQQVREFSKKFLSVFVRDKASYLQNAKFQLIEANRYLTELKLIMSVALCLRIIADSDICSQKDLEEFQAKLKQFNTIQLASFNIKDQLAAVIGAS